MYLSLDPTRLFDAIKKGFTDLLLTVVAHDYNTFGISVLVDASSKLLFVT